MIFDFLTDDESMSFCERIVKAMELLYDIDQAKGCELLNEKWRGYDWRDPSNGGTSKHQYLLYHETERDWAGRIGNPHPYTEGPKTDEWNARQTRAEQLIVEFREAGVHAWLCQSS